MTIFVALLLTVLTFIAVILPFFRQRIRPVYAVTDEESQELRFKRDTTYAMLKELEFDYKSGVLTEADYRDLEDRYKRRGISILKDIDSLAGDAGIDAAIEKRGSRLRRKQPANISDEIEDKITGLRQRKPGSVPDEIEDKIRSLRQGKGRFCPQCGTGHQPEALFCAHCGAKLH